MTPSPPPPPDAPRADAPRTNAPQADAGMSNVVHRNIRALTEVRRQEERKKTLGDRTADQVTRFAGSMWCVYVHLVWFGGWLVWNAGVVPRLAPFDPFPFVMLAMIASVEAIFLSTFILISQNRMQRMADRRAELDLQIGLLTEHELTRAIHLLDEVARHLGVARPPDPEMQEIKRDVRPEQVVEQIARAEDQIDRQEPQPFGGGGRP